MSAAAKELEHVAWRRSLVLGIEATPAQALSCLTDLKVARLTRDPQHLHSVTDIAVFSDCLAKVQSDA